jgi:hypothetical protein
MSKHVKGERWVDYEPDFFSRLEPAEHRTRRDYLLSQEIVRQQRITKRDPKARQYILTAPDLVDRGKLQMIVLVRRPQDLRPQLDKGCLWLPDWMQSPAPIETLAMPRIAHATSEGGTNSDLQTSAANFCAIDGKASNGQGSP